ncbi:MAG: phosphopentomutase [Ruminococcus sp.]|nr:phosphopentomutase [Ruminococcus sp.]
MSKRVFLIVLDSLGIGEAPDAELFGDKGANTLKAISKSEKFNIPYLRYLGLCNIDSVDYLDDVTLPQGAYARLCELSKGKDTTIGHWEISGIVSDKALPTYPNGFPAEIISEFEQKCGRKVLCNKPYSGTQVIKDYGEEHITSGALIVYTSADSVFQIAAHEDIVSVDKLYEYCQIARNILQGEHGVGRVIARPFIGENGNFTRTSNRHDFSLAPPKETMLDAIKSSNLDCIAVGKIYDIFAGKGITEHCYTKNNDDGMQKATQYQNKDFSGLCFINLVDFDMTFGHRRDVDGYANALSQFDKWLGSFIENMLSDDLLIITADHGCDPSFTKTTDHTREYVPLIAYSRGITPANLGTREGLCDIGKSVCDYLNVENNLTGNSFIEEIYE